jgi:hypothetical protein
VRFRQLVKHVAVCALVICAVPIFSSLASGSIFNYADVNVPGLNFTGTVEDTTNPSVVKFGQPQGGSFYSLPNYFLGSTSVFGVGGGAENTSFTTDIAVTSPTLNCIQSVIFNEGGNYFLTSAGTGTTSASIASTGSKLIILEENGVPVSPITITPVAGDFSNTFSINSTATQSGDWSGSLKFVIPAGSNATKVQLVLNNLVNTTSTSTSVAFLGGAKSSLDMNVNVVPIPEPSSIVLLSMGALLFAFIRRRKK